MVATDRAYRDQRARESKFRSVRDAGVAEVNSKVIVLRQAFGGIYSEETLAEMGFARRTPQQPGELYEQVVHLAFRLSEPNFDLTDVQVDGFQVDLPSAIADLGPAVDKLGSSIDNLAREVRLSEAAMLAKNDALEEYNRTFLYIARTVESYLRLAGLDEVARRVRPSSHRPGLTVLVNAERRNGRSDGEAPTDGESEGDAPPETPAETPASADAPSAGAPPA